MNDATAPRSVVIERELPYPPEKIWRALTQPHLMEEWLMKSDFKPAVGHRFNFRADYLPNGALDCEVLALQPNRTLSYTWNSAGQGGAHGLTSIVTWTLTPTRTGTHLRMEQSGFPADQPQYFQGVQYGWQKFIAALEGVLAKPE